MKHRYTSELELKSLLIRINNDNENLCTKEKNNIINKYIRWHTLISEKEYDTKESLTKRNVVKAKLKMQVVELSERTRIDYRSKERFGTIILLMIKKILSKPNLSGYTYQDDFYSDAQNKIFLYMHNFNHLKISERTGYEVNAFAYISQIIFNSVKYVINIKKKQRNQLNLYITDVQTSNNIIINDFDNQESKNMSLPASEMVRTEYFYIEGDDIIEKINKIESTANFIHCKVGMQNMPSLQDLKTLDKKITVEGV